MSCFPQNLPFQSENTAFENYEHCAVPETTFSTRSRSSANAREVCFSARPPVEPLPSQSPAEFSFLSVSFLSVIQRFLFIASLLVLASPARSQIFADWVSSNGTTVTGIIGGTSITFTRDANGAFDGGINLNGEAAFANALYSPATPFSPSLSSSDAIPFVGKKSPNPVPNYTITFGASVIDPILLIASNASTLTFNATPNFISGTTNATAEFIVSGNQIIGTDYDGTYTDANGTVKFIGTFTSISFSAVYFGPARTGLDGISLQVGVAAIPEPSTSAAIAGVFMLGLVLYRRRRA